MMNIVYKLWKMSFYYYYIYIVILLNNRYILICWIFCMGVKVCIINIVNGSFILLLF